MHDMRALRDDPAAFDRGWALRGLAPQASAILALDERLRAAQTALQVAQSSRNDVSKRIGHARGAGRAAEATALLTEVEALKGVISQTTETQTRLSAELHALIAALPNLPAPDTPAGADEHGNVEIRRWGQPFAISAPKDHVDLGAGLGLMDFEVAARMSGSRFVVLKQQLARLERALADINLPRLRFLGPRTARPRRREASRRLHPGR